MRGRRGLSIIVVAALLAATAIAVGEAWEAEVGDADRERMAVAGQAAARAGSAVEFVASGLEGAQGLLTPDGGLRVRGFRLFAERVGANQGFEAIAWLPLVSGSQRAAFERQAGAIRAPDGDGGVAPAERARHYLPIRYVEGDVRARALQGLDVLSVPGLAQTATDARDGAEPRLSPPFQVGERPRMVVLFQPLYLPGRPIRTVGGRRQALQGMIAGALPTDLLAEGVADQLPATSLSIHDSGEPVFEAAGALADQASAPVMVMGRRWLVSVGGVAEPSLVPATLIALGGLVFTALVAWLFRLAARRERELEAGRRAAERVAAREALLVRVGDSLERTISLEGRLDELARAVVPGLADLCAVDLELDERGLKRVGAAASDSRNERTLRALPARPEASPTREALLTGEVKLLSSVDDDLIRELGEDAGELSRLRGLEIEAMIVAPLWARARVLGVLTLCTVAGSARRPFDEDDAALAREIADRAALALDNARLYEEQLDIARTLQRALLPRRLPQPPRLEVAARYRAGREGHEVGGDFYDIFSSRDGWAAVVGDVCGKGADAAALTSMVRLTLRAGADVDGPADALTRVDRAIHDETGGAMFCTLAYAHLDVGGPGEDRPARLTAATGGHPQPLVVRPNGRVEAIGSSGPLLGAFGDARFTEVSLELAPGETLVLFTDGVVEARTRGRLFGEGRLREVLAAAATIPLEMMLASLEDAVVRFADGQPQDDLALLGVRLVAADEPVASPESVARAGSSRPVVP
jgi:serine phosphatase RsbU (regulator of sigma subunit)/CHASE1-domain containing sensor protein